ncbi:MAG TPA: TetR/AcrR family transcriptional regulator [Nevskiales bacterium]|nr:TetR/AcrR family transcriptional regulator [Nevskiales bacterium]
MAEDRKTLTADDWAAAALDAIARDGIDAVAVEPLARRLGVTKGSFYWHFANREALLMAALALWERKETEETFAAVRREPDPRVRIQKLFASVHAGERAARLYQALSAAAAHDPRIKAVVQRASERGLQFLNDCYRALGLSARDAAQWAMMAYSVYLGTLQVRRDQPGALPAGSDYQAYVQFLTQNLLPAHRPASGAKIA